MRIHFIAIGGSAMHNLAIALHKQGHIVSGSDDEIFEPSKTRLRNYDLLPKQEGWNIDNITTDLDAVILGMHAKQGNPELKKARELNLPLYSFPSYLYEHAKDKTRIVIGGSHGKTTITAMILHALEKNQIDAYFLVGSQLEGFEVMVKLSRDTEIMIFEGDEYLTSATDPRPKFHVYKPHIALLSGIAWDHFNVFPTFENYIDQFRTFINLLPANGTLVYYKQDKVLQKVVNEYNGNAQKIPYSIADYENRQGKTIVYYNGKEYPMEIFGEHNLKNMQGAMHICKEIGLPPEEFYLAMTKFKGASNRLQKIDENEKTKVFKDFAHSPSKVKATTEAVKNQFPNQKLVGVLELHTYSSLNKEFLDHYNGSMDTVDIPVVFFNKHALELKQLPMLEKRHIYKSFHNENITVLNKRDDLEKFLKAISWKDKNLLLMSSGNFDGLNKQKLCNELLS